MSMQEVDLIFPTELDEAQVTHLLFQAESGFEVDGNRPLASSLVDGFTIVGVVLNAFSLATTLLSLKGQLDQSAKAKKLKAKEIRIRKSQTSEIHILPTGEMSSLVKTLEEITKRHGPKV